MKNILIYSDSHLNKSCLKESISIFEELELLGNKYMVDTFINLGDTFDGLKPTSQEMDVFATFIRRTGKHHIIIAADSHESTTQEESTLNHYGILASNVQVVKEYKEGRHLYCGHFSIKESSSNYDAKLSKIDFKNYLYVFLGHIHSYQLIKPNIVHLGSCRYVNFDEAKDKEKIVALITDYGTETEKVHFLKLKSPIPMIQLEIGKIPTIGGSTRTIEGENSLPRGAGSEFPRHFQGIPEISAFLDDLAPKNKVKVKILDFDTFRKFLPSCNKYCNKFEVFKYDTDFNVVSDLTPTGAKTQIINFKESFNAWLKTQSIDSEIIKILQKEAE